LTANNLRKSGAGHLRIGVVPSLGLEVAPAAISVFREKYPDVTFDIKTLHHNDMLRSLYERECDLTIGYDPPEQPRLKLKRLAAADLVLVARAGAIQPDLQAFPISELHGREMVSVTGSGPLGDQILTALERAQVEVRGIVSVSTYYVAAALVRFGSGVAIVDEFTARSVARQDLDLFTLSPALRFGIHAAWLEDRPLSKLGLQFVATVEDVLRSLPQLPRRA
jgi:DNA-binding transcriptional LysR family regulator